MRILVTGHNGYIDRFVSCPFGPNRHELASSRTSARDHDHGDIFEAR
jgi:hypothetical protein